LHTILDFGSSVVAGDVLLESAIATPVDNQQANTTPYAKIFILCPVLLGKKFILQQMLVGTSIIT
jgi:hypothetical protein